MQNYVGSVRTTTNPCESFSYLLKHVYIKIEQNPPSERVLYSQTDPNCCCLINIAVRSVPVTSHPPTPPHLPMSKEEAEIPKYQLEDILNKKKPPPQILDLHNIKQNIKDISLSLSHLLIAGQTQRRSLKRRQRKFPTIKSRLRR